MPTLSFQTAGESHGQSLIAIIQGLPAGLRVDFDFVNSQLRRRQGGYGRGGRMKIETDQAQYLSGVRLGKTIGAPVTLLIENKDWANWQDALSVDDRPLAQEKYKPLSPPRPGHADLAGCLKYNFREGRFILERASARETASRVAVGAMAQLLLANFEVELPPKPVPWERIRALREQQEIILSCVDPETEAQMKAEVDKALKTKDSLGGTFEVIAHNVPPGLGTHTQWDRRLDGLLAQAIVSIQAVKAVEIGSGITNASSFGSNVHDAISYDGKKSSFIRPTNRAGGIEGGITNGEDVVVRGYLKPISTLRQPLESVDLETKKSVKAAYERSDICVVPAAGVAGEAMVAWVLAGAFLDKFGGDSLKEMSRNFEGYMNQVKQF